MALTLVLGACNTGTATESSNPPPVPETTIAITTTIQPTTTSTLVETTTTTTTIPPPFDDGFEFLRASESSDETIAVSAVVFADGVWNMFVQTERKWLVDATLWLVTSDDGVDWDWEGRRLLFTTDDLRGDAVRRIRVTDAIVLEDGTWALYFNTLHDKVPLSFGSIGRLTAPGPEGPWVMERDPVLVPGPEGSWDATGVGYPSVIRVDDGYRMYFAGRGVDTDGNVVRGIGLAMSDDGVHWSRWNDSATTDGLFATSDPILRADTEADTWYSNALVSPDVLESDGGFVMTYVGWSLAPYGGIDHEYSIGLAFSDDGVEWTADPVNPFFRARRLGYQWIGTATLVAFPGRYEILVNLEQGGGGGSFDISVYRVIHEGELAPTTSR